MEFGKIILVVGVAGIAMLMYKVTNRRRAMSPQQWSNVNKTPRTPSPKVKTSPPEFTDSEMSSIINLVTKLDAVYKKM